MVIGGTIPGMDATTARTVNMRRLIAQAGGPAEWARKFGGDRWTQPQVSQWISETNPKSIGGRLARDLESVQGLENGALDRPPHMASQPVGIDPEILADAMKLLRATDAILGEPPEASINPYRLAVAYQAILEEGGTVSDGKVIDFTARLAKKLREKGEHGDFGSAAAGTGGTTGGAHGAKRGARSA